jgi:hypothetical protein
VILSSSAYKYQRRNQQPGGKFWENRKQRGGDFLRKRGTPETGEKKDIFENFPAILPFSLSTPCPKIPYEPYPHNHTLQALWKKNETETMPCQQLPSPTLPCAMAGVR